MRRNSDRVVLELSPQTSFYSMQSCCFYLIASSILILSLCLRQNPSAPSFPSFLPSTSLSLLNPHLYSVSHLPPISCLEGLRPPDYSQVARPSSIIRTANLLRIPASSTAGNLPIFLPASAPLPAYQLLPPSPSRFFRFPVICPQTALISASNHNTLPCLAGIVGMRDRVSTPWMSPAPPLSLPVMMMMIMIIIIMPTGACSGTHSSLNGVMAMRPLTAPTRCKRKTPWPLRSGGCIPGPRLSCPTRSAWKTSPGA